MSFNQSNSSKSTTATASSKLVVLGAGAWGTALAVHAHHAGNEVTLWAYLDEEKQDIETHRENKSRLPGVTIPKEITVTTDLSCVKGADYLLVVTPAQVIRSFLKDLKPHLSENTKLIFCSKGIEIETGSLISEICSSSIPHHTIGFFSGPNFAKEIANGAPGASTIAFDALKDAQDFSNIFSTRMLRVYPNNDIIGVQIGGAYKNVLAIAAGILKGSGYGENALAALVTRGLEETSRFATFKGANPNTLRGMSGMGDLILCCYSTTSRNMKLGFDLGKDLAENKGRESIAESDSQDDSQTASQPLTEGAFTVKALHKIAQSNALDLPLCEAVYSILFEQTSLNATLEKLLTRNIPTQEIQNTHAI